MYFEKLNEQSAYALGFLAADGWISGNSLGFALKGSDKAAVERVADIISKETGYSGIDIVEYKSKCSNGKYYPAVKFSVHSRWIVYALGKYGIVPKSLT